MSDYNLISFWGNTPNIATGGIVPPTGPNTPPSGTPPGGTPITGVPQPGTPVVPYTPSGPTPPAETPGGQNPLTAPPNYGISAGQTTWQGIAQEQATQSEIQIQRTEEQLGQTLLGEQVAEVQAEGGIRASAAARGLKMAGSPLMQTIAQQQEGEQTIGFTQRQGQAAVMGMQIARQTEYDWTNLAGTEKDQSAQNDMFNTWINAFSNIISMASGMVSKFWNPLSALTSAATEVSGPDTSGNDTFGYG